jgi:hypothetical protein
MDLDLFQENDMQLKDDEILVESHGHTYRIAVIRETKVVYDHKMKMFFEYTGDEYLDPQDEVVTVKVAF